MVWYIPGLYTEPLQNKDSERLYTVVIEEIAGKYGKIYTWEMKSKLMGRIGREAAAALVETVGLPITPEEYIYQSQEIFRRVFPSCEVMPDTEVIYTRCTEEIAARYGKTYPWEVKLKQMGRTAPDLAKVIVEELGLPLLPWEYAAEARIIQEKSFTECQLMPGAEKLVRHLKSKKIPIAVATSSSEETFKLKTTNHREFFKIFDHIVFGSSDPEVKNGKPAPDIFLICASRFPDKPAPENCLVFEDAPNGVTAALAAGMQVVMVPDPRMDELNRSRATFCVDRLENFKPEVFGLPPYDSAAT
ncbi:pseudouridine-5'-phosphatase-like isoform X2 [Artemia franciscana]|uniref:pseudouridine 5'-phosphatase n=1 Tax=Artemia franciscana TaxID=6661 RepID=A0AA88L7H7_ARTSF|nr:hypothetical protein QYM36_005307 [Artemia franciscana]